MILLSILIPTLNAKRFIAMVEETLLENYNENITPNCNMIFLSTLAIMNLPDRTLNQKDLSLTNNSILTVLSFSILLSMVAFIEDVNALSFSVLPPEINSARLFSGIGLSPVIVQAESIFNSIHSAIADIENIDRINQD